MKTFKVHSLGKPDRVTLLICIMGVLWLLPPASSTSDQCGGQPTWSDHLSNFTMDTGPSRLHVFSHDLHLPCPSEPTVPSSALRLTLQNLSVCPWIQAVHYDFDRFPHAMTYARCNCGRCSNETPGVTRGSTRRRCVPLYQTFHVLRRVCEAGNVRIMMSFDRLPIACVCIQSTEDDAT